MAIATGNAEPAVGRREVSRSGASALLGDADGSGPLGR